MAVVFATCAVAHAQTPSAGPAASATPPPAARRAPQTSFAITSPQARQILRDAVAQGEPQAPASTSTSEPPPTDATRLDVMPPLRFRGPRGVHHMECDASNCMAVNAEGTTLYTVSRDENLTYHGPRGNGGYDAWLSCQSTNNLLTTFERYDKCRGIQIGLPAGNVLLALPRLNVE